MCTLVKQMPFDIEDSQASTLQRKEDFLKNSELCVTMNHTPLRSDDCVCSHTDQNKLVKLAHYNNMSGKLKRQVAKLLYNLKFKR
jgi:hypothetical protein